MSAIGPHKCYNACLSWINSFVTIMVLGNDLCAESCVCQRWSKVVVDKIDFFSSRHRPTGLIIGILWFILRSYYPYRNTLSLHSGYVFYKVIGISRVVSSIKATSYPGIVGFHPDGSRPWSSENLDAGINQRYLLD